MRYVRLLLLSLVLSGLLLIAQGRGTQPVLALHHIAQISEVMSGFAGDPDVQFVEIELLALYQQSVTNTRLTVFNADSTFNTVLLDPLGSNVSTSPGRVLMATQAFVDLTPSPGVTPDFIFPPGILPDAGMVCWGGPGTSTPVTFDTTDPNQYVDCVSYGGTAFTGSNPMMSNPGSAGPGAGDGKLSLTRILDSTGKVTNPWRNSDTGTFYDLLDPSPENNAGVTGTLVQPASVGGIAELPRLDGGQADVAGAPLAAGESSGLSAGLLAGIVAGATAGAIALGGAAWYVRRRNQSEG